MARRRGDRVARGVPVASVLAAALLAGVVCTGCGSSSSTGGLAPSATPDVRAMLSLVGAGAVPTYRAVYAVTGPGGVGGPLVVDQRPPITVYATGGVVVRVAPGAPRTAQLAGIVVSRPVLLGVIEHDGQLIEEGNPGGALATVARGRQTVGGQASTCLTVTGSVGHQVICTTATGIPTEVLVSGTHAVLTSLSPAVVDGELAPPAG